MGYQLPITDFLSLLGDRLRDPTKLKFSLHKPFGDCGLSITNFLSLSGDRLGDLTKFDFIHSPFGNCGLSITAYMQVYPTCLLSMRRKTMVIGDVFAGSSPATCALVIWFRPNILVETGRKIKFHHETSLIVQFIGVFVSSS